MELSWWHWAVLLVLVVIAWRLLDIQRILSGATPKQAIRHGKRIIRITAGVAVILIGMGLGFVPGIPGFPLVFLGLTILAIDFVWARRLKKKLQDQTRAVIDKVRGKPKVETPVEKR